MEDLRRRWRSRCLAAVTAALVLAGGVPGIQAANHREAPITALDHKADITDVYAFRSYNGSTSLPRVTLILDVDPLLEPGNGPTYFPFDDEILYAIRIDNDHDAAEDIVFEVRFKTEIRNQSGLLRGLWQSYVGAGAGVNSPANSPAPVPPGTPIIPPQVTSFQDDGLALRQSYTVTMVRPKAKPGRVELQQAAPCLSMPSRRTPGRGRWTTRLCSTPGPTPSAPPAAARATASRSGPARRTIRSGSISAGPSTP